MKTPLKFPIKSVQPVLDNVRPEPTDVRFSITIDFLYNGQTRLKAPGNRDLVIAMLKDAMAIAETFSPVKPQGDKEPDSGLIIKPTDADARLLKIRG